MNFGVRRMVMLVLAPLVAVVALPLRAEIPAAGRFHVQIRHRTFDGSSIDSMFLVADRITMVTDNFGAWDFAEESEGGGALTLKNRRTAAVTVRIVPVRAADVPVLDRQWTDYVRGISRGLGERTIISEQYDSDKGAPAVAVLGWRTREALFVAPGMDERAERHVVACSGDGGVLFVLTGPHRDIAAADAEFRFMLARLAVR